MAKLGSKLVTAFPGIVMLSAIAFGTYNYFHYQSVCGDTKNPALCELHLQSGHSDIEARNAGNHIFN